MATAKMDAVESSGSSSEFDPSLSEDERRFYTKAYPSIDLVRDRKVHCTVCKVHIGTAPSQESNIKMHPILRVTHCTKCHDFYNSGEFSKGEDGSELYCRWCGQGGEVYCCSNCPYVFCKSCIVKNLSRGVVADIEQNENWSCFKCAPKILWPLRAQHWAHTKYIDKQKKTLQSLNLSEGELKQQMSNDRSTCCRLAKAKTGNMSDSLESIDSITSRRSQGSSGSIKRVHKLSGSGGPKPAVTTKRAKTSNDEVVCTPDLMSMLEPDCQITVSPKTRPLQSPAASSPKILSIQTGYGALSSQKASAPPPLVLRNTSVQMRPIVPSSTSILRRTVTGPRIQITGGPVTPVYHTINGYKIDLNTAAQQETFRLPNGKLIQVKRQGSATNQSTPSPTSSNWQQRSLVQENARPVHIQATGHFQTVSNPSSINASYTQHMQQQPMVRYHNTATVGNSNVTTVNPIQVINGTTIAAPQTQTSNVAQRPVMVRHVFPETAIGQARTQLQDQVFSAIEISQHLTAKAQTLTNSNAYKQARNYLEVKELYIHLSYLLTYVIGRCKGLQDKLVADMRQLGFVTDADSLENGQLAADKQASDDEDNEIEIVEPKTDTITLDSDNEDAEMSKDASSTTAVASSTSAAAAEMDLMSVAKTFLAQMLEVDYGEADQVCGAQGSPGGSTDSMQKKQPRKKTTNKPNPTLLKQKEMLQREKLEEMKRSDMKLKMECAIKLKKAEHEYPFAKKMLSVGKTSTKETSSTQFNTIDVSSSDISAEDIFVTGVENSLTKVFTNCKEVPTGNQLITSDIPVEDLTDLTEKDKEKKLDHESLEITTDAVMTAVEKSSEPGKRELENTIISEGSENLQQNDITNKSIKTMTDAIRTDAVNPPEKKENEKPDKLETIANKSLEIMTDGIISATGSSPELNGEEKTDKIGTVSEESFEIAADVKIAADENSLGKAETKVPEDLKTIADKPLAIDVVIEVAQNSLGIVEKKVETDVKSLKLALDKASEEYPEVDGEVTTVASEKSKPQEMYATEDVESSSALFKKLSENNDIMDDNNREEAIRTINESDEIKIAFVNEAEINEEKNNKNGRSKESPESGATATEGQPVNNTEQKIVVKDVAHKVINDDPVTVEKEINELLKKSSEHREAIVPHDSPLESLVELNEKDVNITEQSSSTMETSTYPDLFQDIDKMD